MKLIATLLAMSWYFYGHNRKNIGKLFQNYLYAVNQFFQTNFSRLKREIYHILIPFWTPLGNSSSCLLKTVVHFFGEKIFLVRSHRRKNSISLKIVNSLRRENVDISLNFEIWRLLLRLRKPESKNTGRPFGLFHKVEKTKGPPIGWHAIPGKKDRKYSNNS